MKFKVKITQEVLDAVKMCGVEKKSQNYIENNCLFAYCYNQLIQNCKVCYDSILFYGKSRQLLDTINNSNKISRAISYFDTRIKTRATYFLNKEYELKIPDKVIEYWYKDVSKGVQKLINEGNKILTPIP
jgi:hypothetical protein